MVEFQKIMIMTGLILCLFIGAYALYTGPIFPYSTTAENRPDPGHTASEIWVAVDTTGDGTLETEETLQSAIALKHFMREEKAAEGGQVLSDHFPNEYGSYNPEYLATAAVVNDGTPYNESPTGSVTLDSDRPVLGFHFEPASFNDGGICAFVVPGYIGIMKVRHAVWGGGERLGLTGTTYQVIDQTCASGFPPGLTNLDPPISLTRLNIPYPASCARSDAGWQGAHVMYFSEVKNGYSTPVGGVRANKRPGLTSIPPGQTLYFQAGVADGTDWDGVSCPIYAIYGEPIVE